MAEPTGFRTTVKKRWRGWLRAIHRDFGYLAVGFTLIYALSGIAINHIADWDPNFHATEKTLTIAPIPAEISDDEAVKRVIAATGTGTPDDVFRAGDEIRISYHSGTQVTVIGDTGDVTVQARSDRFFFRVANWLHYNRGKKAWTYVADIYAVMLLYLAISGLFMIKGRLGLRWRGSILVGIGVAVPLGYVILSGGPSKSSGTKTASAPTETAPSATTPSELTPSEIKPMAPRPAPAIPAVVTPAASADEFARPPVLKQPAPGQ